MLSLLQWQLDRSIDALGRLAGDDSGRKRGSARRERAHRVPKIQSNQRWKFFCSSPVFEIIPRATQINLSFFFHDFFYLKNLNWPLCWMRELKIIGWKGDSVWERLRDLTRMNIALDGVKKLRQLQNETRGSIIRGIQFPFYDFIFSHEKINLLFTSLQNPESWF